MDSNSFIEATRYDLRTGELLGLRGGILRDIASEGFPFVIGTGDPETQYVDILGKHPTLRPRPRMPIAQHAKSIPADGKKFLRLTSIPQGASVGIAGETYAIDDGTLEWATLLPGVYSITVSLFPYLDWTGEVTVIADPA